MPPQSSCATTILPAMNCPAGLILALLTISGRLALYLTSPCSIISSPGKMPISVSRTNTPTNTDHYGTIEQNRNPGHHRACQRERHRKHQICQHLCRHRLCVQITGQRCNHRNHLAQCRCVVREGNPKPRSAGEGILRSCLRKAEEQEVRSIGWDRKDCLRHRSQIGGTIEGIKETGEGVKDSPLVYRPFR